MDKVLLLQRLILVYYFLLFSLFSQYFLKGMYHTITFSMEDSTAVVKMPIVEEYIPNTFFQVEIVGNALRLNDTEKEDPNVPPRVAFATGNFEISVPPVRISVVSFQLH